MNWPAEKQTGFDRHRQTGWQTRVYQTDERRWVGRDVQIHDQVWRRVTIATEKKSSGEKNKIRKHICKRIYEIMNKWYISKQINK